LLVLSAALNVPPLLLITTVRGEPALLSGVVLVDQVVNVEVRANAHLGIPSVDAPRHLPSLLSSRLTPPLGDDDKGDEHGA
jgi:hypothetical protein